MSAIFDLPLSSANDFILYAIEKETEQATWEIWLSLYPSMTKGELKHKSFDDFKKVALRPVVKTTPKTEEKIEEEMNKVIARYEGR